MTSYSIRPRWTSSDLNWAPRPRNCLPRGSVMVRSTGLSQFLKNCPPRGSVRSQGDWLCVCVIKTRTCEWMSMSRMGSFWGPGAQIGSDVDGVVRCGLMWSDVLWFSLMQYLRQWRRRVRWCHMLCAWCMRLCCGRYLFLFHTTPMQQPLNV